MLVPETTDHREAPASDLTASPAATNPLPRLTYAPEPTSAPNTVRGLNHPHELVLRGIPVMCSACGARRDWLLINQGRHVWISCRCSHQWLEPEISRADYEAMVAVPGGTSYPSVKQGLSALGFDGSFAGTYLA